MKKLLLICLTFIGMQVSAQDLKTMTSEALSNDASSSLIDNFAADQVKALTKKLNLSTSQQEQVTSLVVQTLKSDKFKSMLSGMDPSSLLGANDKKAKVQKAIMEDEDFKKGMGDILTDEQKKNIKG